MIRLFVCFHLVLAGTILNAGAAMTAVQTVGFSAASNGTYTDAGDGNLISITSSRALSGFTKFDPSLGTLTEIKLTVEMDGYLEMTLIVDQLDPDTATEFTALYDSSEGLDSLVQAGIIYRPTGNTIGIATTIDSGSLPTVGAEDEPTAPYITDQGEGLQFFYTDDVTETFGGFSAGGTTPTEATLLASNPDFNSADFVGLGNVVGLTVDNIVIIENDFSSLTLNNVPLAYVSPEVGFTAGNATLQYVYTPIPEPGASALFVLCLAAGAIRRRR